MNCAVDGFFGVVSQGPSKGEIVGPVVDKFVLLCAMFLTSCAAERESVTGPPFPTSNHAQQRGEYGDGISYWDDTRSGGKPRIVIDLEQQQWAYFYRGDTMIGRSIVSTGREGYDTLQVISESRRKTWPMSRAFMETASTEAARW